MKRSCHQRFFLLPLFYGIILLFSHSVPFSCRAVSIPSGGIEAPTEEEVPINTRLDLGVFGLRPCSLLCPSFRSQRYHPPKEKRSHTTNLTMGEKASLWPFFYCSILFLSRFITARSRFLSVIRSHGKSENGKKEALAIRTGMILVPNPSG